MTSLQPKMWGERKLPPYVLLLFPAVTFMVLMYAWPFISSVLQSFIISGKEGGLTLANYVKVWELYRKDIAFTFAVTIFNTFLVGVVAVIFSVYFRLRQNRVSALLSAIFKLPIFIPFVVVSQMMNSFLAPHGLLNTALAQLGLVNLDKPLQLFNFAGLSFGFAWKQIPFAVLIIHGGFQMIDNSYIEAARSIGAKLPSVILRVLVPMNKSSIIVALVLVYSQIIGTFTLPYMLIGGKVPTTITVDIAHRVNYFRDFGVANALGVCSYIMVLFTAAYYLRSKIKEARQEVSQ
ncbi:Binding-protein-dependent transport systems inner membrane component [uncultured spirochete]|uniref:Binding-protein-dependent transport systems inner membrane component n=1 Tax=uncultured spirochete TaxID=156406 RepID=A0A3P3XJJ5_9SPIR|nr:ABC transporter permease subunit [Rectinema subterraneum]SLM13797.1 Binding-protein-dependent transport systems inner membrane component [uncultured spirochete]